jgi:hypothetical protein
VWYCCLYSNAWTPYGSWEHNKAFKVNCCHRRSEKHLCLICSFVLCSSIKIKESENATRTVLYFLLFFETTGTPSFRPLSHMFGSPDIYRGKLNLAFCETTLSGPRQHTQPLAALGSNYFSVNDKEPSFSLHLGSAMRSRRWRI